MAIIWRKKMTVGNSIIDDQHRYLLCLMNTIELALRDAKNRDILKTAIDQLFEYTAYHFKFEEHLQARVKYPMLIEHKAEHEKILADLEVIKVQLDKLFESNHIDNALQLAENHDISDISDSELQRLIDKGLNKNNEDLDLTQLTTLVRHWVIDHVLGDDLKMRPFLSKLPAHFT